MTQKFSIPVMMCLWAAWGVGVLGKDVPGPRRVVPESTPPIRGQLRVAQLDASNLCLTGSYQRFLVERFTAECGPFLKLLESPEYQPRDWSRRFHYTFAAAEVIGAYRPQIAAAYQNGGGFRVRDARTGREVPIRRTGYWLNPVSAARFPDFGPNGGEALPKAAQVTHHAYLELAEPLRDGGRYTLQNPLGETVTFTFAEKNRSEAVHVNQVGTRADAGRKYAYLGQWRGPELGARDYSDWEGKPFEVLDVSRPKAVRSVFQGAITRRVVSEASAEFSGEDVYDLDFSEFSTPGKYVVYVPGVGTSWPFVLGNDAIGEAFYVRMRGMFHKRCGCAKGEPFTAWTGGACHMQTFQGTFPPNWRHYGDRGAAGFYDSEGKLRATSAFEVIRQTCEQCDPPRNTDANVVPGLHGGWHDAADYDRRSLHLQSVGDFTAAFVMFPQNFSDGQLFLPESGNRVPDILDEAVWGADVWRRAQNVRGGVGCWIEASSHPGNYVPETDTQPYFLALPTMESSADYAGYAAALAWALKKAGDDTRAKLFQDSAVRAYRFAQDPKNRCERKYPGFGLRVDGKTVPTDLTYRESEDLSGAQLGKAAFNLYLLTRDRAYLADVARFRPLGLDRYVAELSWNGSALYLAEFLVEGAEFPELEDAPEFIELRENIRKQVLALADTRLAELNDHYQYRMPWYAADHAYVSHTSWGNFHPLNRARPLVVAWRVTGDTKYRDAALLCNDWQLGANPTNSSMTSGLGRNYPVRFLDLPSYADGVAEFVPGITPYRNTYGLARPAVEMAYGLYYTPRTDHKFEAQSVPLLPKSLLPADGSVPEIGDYAKRVGGGLPIWRRFANVEGWSVAASEYTVWETMAPAAAITGCLLDPGWMPDARLKNRRPVADPMELPGAWALP